MRSLVVALTLAACGKIGLDDYNIYPPPPTQSSNDTTPFGLVAWFPLDGDFTDAVSGQPATCTNCPTMGAGVVGSAAQFNGTTDCLHVPWLASWQPDVYTIAAWVNASAMSGPVAVRTYDSAGCPSPALSTTNGGVGFTGVNKMVSHQEAWTSPMIVQSTWQHVALVWDGTSQQVFVDGSCTCSITPPIGFRYNPTSALSIGCYPEANTFMHGAIDDVRVYERPLAAEEIAMLAAEDGSSPVMPTACATVCGTAAP